MDFSKILLFKGIDNAECCKMMTCFSSTFKTFKSGDVVCDYSVKDNNVGVLLSGNAIMIRTDINGIDTVLEIYKEGDIFGEVLAFSNLKGDSIKIVAQSKCDIMFIAYDQITKRCSNACLHHSILVSNMLELIAIKAHRLSQRIEILSQRSIREKLLYYFEILRKEYGNDFNLDITMTRLAEYLCVDRCAMTRELNRLREEKILKLNKKHVTML